MGRRWLLEVGKSWVCRPWRNPHLLERIEEHKAKPTWFWFPCILCTFSFHSPVPPCYGLCMPPSYTGIMTAIGWHLDMGPWEVMEPWGPAFPSGIHPYKREPKCFLAPPTTWGWMSRKWPLTRHTVSLHLASTLLSLWPWQDWISLFISYLVYSIFKQQTKQKKDTVTLIHFQFLEPQALPASQLCVLNLPAPGPTSFPVLSVFSQICFLYSFRVWCYIHEFIFFNICLPSRIQFQESSLFWFLVDI